MNGYFDSGTYNTPVEAKPALKELLCHNRIYFTLKYAIVVFRSKRQAKNKVYGRKEWADSSYYILKFIEGSGGKFHITGMENISKIPGPVIFIGNHMSTLETMVLPSIIAPHREVTFVVKDALVKHPLFRDVMKSRDPIVVGRSDPRKDFEAVMTEGMDKLSKGISIVIFPQSTRSVEFKPEEFNSLGVKLAKKAGVPVVPIALKTDFWGNGRIVKELGPLDSKKHIHIRFGEPFELLGSGRDENQKIISFIQASLEEWEKEDL
jgi:1-acyl-sn-glycerol-3-phosphate acyltransferase